MKNVYIILLFLLITVLLLFVINQKEIRNEDKKNEYDFIKYIANWSRNMKRRFYKGESLYDISHNKYRTYLFCKSLNIPTPRLYYHGKINNFDFSKLPSEYVIKPTDGYSSEGVFIMDKNINKLDKKYYSNDEIKSKLKDRLCLIEEYIKDNNNDIPNDYKVYVIKDKIVAILVIDSRKINEKDKMVYKKRFYDEKWNTLPLITHGDQSKIIKSPKELSQLIYFSKKIGKIMDTAIRVDFYIGKHGIVLGELTSHPSGATGYTDFGKRLLNDNMKKLNLRTDDGLNSVKIVNLFWTGGYDSTFRVCQAVIEQNKIVQPYYILANIDNCKGCTFYRKNRKQEMNAIKNVINKLASKYPNKARNILPVRIIEQYPPDDYELTKKFHDMKLHSVNRKFNQYEAMCRYAKSNNIRIEIGTVGILGEDSILPKDNWGMYLRNNLKYKDGNYQVEDKSSPIYYLDFPIAFLSKKEIWKIAKKNKYDDILLESWSCWFPINGKPCGKCPMCKNRIIKYPKRSE